MNMTERLLAHNAWATRALIECCRPLTPQQFHQRFDIGPGSLHDTLRHIIGAMLRWADRISDQPVRPSIEKSAGPSSIDDLLGHLTRAESELRAAAASVEREHRRDEFMRAEFSPAPFTRGTAILHVLTHGVHHRAQALNMLRRLGVADVPDVDVIEWELRAAAG